MGWNGMKIKERERENDKRMNRAALLDLVLLIVLNISVILYFCTALMKTIEYNLIIVYLLDIKCSIFGVFHFLPTVRYNFNFKNKKNNKSIE